MDSVDEKSPAINDYFRFLKRLNRTSKLLLISKLNDSLKEDESESVESFYNTYGSFLGEESAEQIIHDIESARNFDREQPEM
jgi:archaellum biogenesis ATPase FlaH